MAGKTFRSTAFKRAIDVGKITTVGADDLVKIWRTATGDEKAISLGDLEVGIAEGLVPYVGAISDVDLGDNSLLVESVTLNPAPVTIPTAQGSMYFDEDEQTLAVILNGVTQKVGEDNFFQVKNQSGATIPKGTAVRFDGVVGSSGRIKVVPFLADGTYPSLYFAGVTDEEILNGGDGKSYILGKVRGLNTNAYPIGTILYCSSTVAGGFTSTPPIAPNNIISVAAVIAQSATVGTLLVRPQIGSNINYDEGVKIVSGTTGDILQLQASGLWENKNLNNQYVTLATAQTITGAKVFNNPLLVLSENNPILRITSTSNTGTLNFRNVFGEDQAGIILNNPANKFSIATRVSNTDIEIAPHGTGSVLLPNIPSGTGDVLMLNGSNEVVKGPASSGPSYNIDLNTSLILKPATGAFSSYSGIYNCIYIRRGNIGSLYLSFKTSSIQQNTASGSVYFEITNTDFYNEVSSVIGGAFANNAEISIYFTSAIPWVNPPYNSDIQKLGSNIVIYLNKKISTTISEKDRNNLAGITATDLQYSTVLQKNYVDLIYHFIF